MNGIRNCLMQNVGYYILSLALLLLGFSTRGDWIVFYVYLKKQNESLKDHISRWRESDESVMSESDRDRLIGRVSFDNLTKYLTTNLIFSYCLYYGLGGYLYWHFYIRQRDKSVEWKCQPGKFLSSELLTREILLGSVNVFLGSSVFSLLACIVDSGGYSTLYYRLDHYGYVWLIASIPLLFVYQEAGAYYVHRFMHTRFMYKHFHVWHHRFKHPTMFSVTALHPVDMFTFQLFMVLPMFIFPVHVLVYAASLLYIYYYGLIQHSGIRLESIWPWQPDTLFHDNHHEFYHVNFGFNLHLFDYLHGTSKRDDRLYDETTFHGSTSVERPGTKQA